MKREKLEREGERATAHRTQGTTAKPKKNARKKNHRMLVSEGSYSHLVEKLVNASAGGILESPNAVFPL